MNIINIPFLNVLLKMSDFLEAIKLYYESKNMEFCSENFL